MVKRFLFILLGILTNLTVNSQNWIDITDDYIINPHFDDNDRTTGWSGTELGAANPKENAEHFSKDYDTYQQLSGLSAGKYRVSLDAFYRMGDSGNDYSLFTSNDYSNYQHAQLYATSSINDYYVKIAPASSAAISNPPGGSYSQVSFSWWGGTDLYIPNNMEAAYYWFEAGYYNNSVECEVGNDGILTIGIRKLTTIGNDWTCIDNWMLEYYGTVVKATTLRLSQSSMTMSVGETSTLSYTILPDNATYHKVSWTSSNSDIVSINSNGMLTANSTGTCVITATTIDGSNKSASCRVTVVQNVPSSSNLIINEIMSANVDVYLDPNQNYGSWVELYNPSKQSVTLGGLYISDDENNLKKHKLIDNYGAIPAQGFAILNFDHHEVWTANAYRQIDDKLDCDGGEIIISDGSSIIARQRYPEAISRCSYARTTDGGDEWQMTGTPSPGISNQAYGGFAKVQLPAPIADKPGQIFSGSLQICVNIPSDAILRYTTDGTAPTLSNGQISSTGIFNISETTCFRFRLFKDGYLPSPVKTYSYIEDNGNYHFPIISIVTDRDNIYSKERGAFMQGPNGRPGNGQTSKCNWNMDWDHPVSFEYITTDNECIVSQECSFSMCGGWSRAWTPHSFKLKSDKAYDFQNTFQAQFFKEKPFLKHKTLQVRNGGNDTQCRIKDPGIQMIVSRSGLNVDYQEWQPAHVFINGSHYAVLNIREPNNKDFAYSNAGIDTDEMDQFEISPDSGYVQMRGTKESFSRLVALSENSSDSKTYDEIKTLLDIDEYINYMAVELYVGNWDWPQNNVKGYRDQKDGKFRFVLFDLDGSLSTSTPFSTFFGKEWYNFDNLHGYDYSQNRSVEGSHKYLQIEFVTLFKNMLQNDEFRKRFIDTFCIIGGSVFKPSHVSEIVNDVKNYLSSGNYVFPSNTANTLINSFSSSYNNNMISQLKSNSQDAIKNDLTSKAKQSVKLSSNNKEGKIFINNIELPYSEFDGYLFAPAVFKAVAPAGYKFVGWKGSSSSNRIGETLIPTGSNWYYYDQGSLDGKDWKNSVDTSWSQGLAPLGYFTSDNNNSRGYRTTLSYGNNSSQKIPTYYFTSTVNLSNSPKSDDEFTLDFIVDDGFIIYVNGVEGGRYNMPSGSVGYNTFSSSYAPNNPDTGNMTLPASLFKKGINVIAVEVHNNNSTSTDIEWEASLTHYTDNSTDFISTDSVFTMPSTGSTSLTACFEEMNLEEMASTFYHPIKINELSAGNDVYVNEYFKKNDWIELYNPTDYDLNIAGLYLSDDINQPTKYQIPSNSLINTIVPAKGHIVVWTDKLEPLTQIHSNFKLSNTDGEMVVITSSDEFVQNNQSYFKNNQLMQSFADGFTYLYQNGTESCGRYPDGTNTLYKMSRVTIKNPNSILYDERPYGEDEGITVESPETFTLSLNEGWNWISHILSNPLKASSFTESTRIVGMSYEAYNDRSYGMTGSLKNLNSGNLYKVQMEEDATYRFTDTFCESDLPIGVHPGWNWIGYTVNGTQSIVNALTSNQLDEGDILMGQDGFSVYTNGAWNGTLSTLETGKGYMFKSSRTKSFCFSSPDVTVKMRHTNQRMTRGRVYGVDKHTHPNQMGLIACLKMDDETLHPDRFTILAYSENECVGVGVTIDERVFVSIYGDGNETITFKAIDSLDGSIYDIKEKFVFECDVKGVQSAPQTLTLIPGASTSIIQPEIANDSRSKSEAGKSVTGYYSIDGQLISKYSAKVQKGIYIVKYNDGSHRKIYVK